MSTNKTISLIRFEIEQVDKLLESYELLIEKCKLSDPDLIEITAAASVIHSFYNGVEKIFLTIGKHIDCKTPEGHQWHRDLLKQMGSKNDVREVAVLSETALNKTLEYMGFRHYYRHAYSFMLSWSEMKPLVFNIHNVWSIVKEDIEKFMEKYET